MHYNFDISKSIEVFLVSLHAPIDIAPLTARTRTTSRPWVAIMWSWCSYPWWLLVVPQQEIVTQPYVKLQLLNLCSSRDGPDRLKTYPHTTNNKNLVLFALHPPLPALPLCSRHIRRGAGGTTRLQIRGSKWLATERSGFP